MPTSDDLLTRARRDVAAFREETARALTLADLKYSADDVVHARPERMSTVLALVVAELRTAGRASTEDADRNAADHVRALAAAMGVEVTS